MTNRNFSRTCLFQSSAQTRKARTMRREICVAAFVALLAAAPAVSNAALYSDGYNEREVAVQLGRQGRYDEALRIFNQLYAKNPSDAGVVRDYLAVLSWAGGHDQQVVDLYTSLNSPDQPDYVLEAVGPAYRNLQHPGEATAIYQRGLVRNPASLPYAVGFIRALGEDGYTERSLNFANRNIEQYGRRPDVLLAAGDVAYQYGTKDSYNYFLAALQVQPSNRDALHGYILAVDKAGWPQVALATANRYPGIVTDAEYRHLVGNDAAALVREGMDGGAEIARNDTGTALNRLNAMIAAWKNDGNTAQDDIRRAEYDRVLAMRNMSMMQDVVKNYESLTANGEQAPAYVLSSVADAYLAMHEPEKARDLYLQVLAKENNNAAVRKQLFYAYAECGDYDNAFLIADGLIAETPAGGDDRISAQLLAGAARLYAGQVSDAEQFIIPAVQSGPSTPYTHEAMGNLYSAHGWPRAALAEYKTGSAMRPGGEINNDIGIASTELQLQHYPEAQQMAQSLIARYPDNQHVQRIKRDQEIHNMAELRVSAFYAPDPLSGVNITGGESYGIDTSLYSSPIYYNWRVFAGDYYTHQNEPRQEGSVGLNQARAGVEYRKGNVTASVAPTLNHYNGTKRMGGTADVTVALSDQWTAAVAGELFARGTPLRALNQGITANSFVGKVTWRQDEERKVYVSANVMPFSDDNTRTGFAAGAEQRLYTAPHFYLNGVAEAAMTTNSEDTNRIYYNPKSDFIALVGAEAVHTLYSRYSTIYQHSLRVTPGVYWENNYGTDAAIRARYEHRLFMGDTLNAGLGVNFLRQSYDGDAENDLSVSFDLVKRF